MIKVSFDDKKNIYVEKIKNRKYLGTHLVSAIPNYVCGIIVPRDYELNPVKDDVVVQSIVKIDGESVDSYTYYISELKNGDKKYIATVKFINGKPHASVDWEDRTIHRVAHKQLNGAEKIDIISAFLRTHYNDIDKTIEFLRGVGYA